MGVIDLLAVVTEFSVVYAWTVNACRAAWSVGRAGGRPGRAGGAASRHGVAVFRSGTSIHNLRMFGPELSPSIPRLLSKTGLIGGKKVVSTCSVAMTSDDNPTPAACLIFQTRELPSLSDPPSF